MSTLNFSEELDFRLIFEDDSRQTAGNLRVFLVTLVSNLSTAVKHLDLMGVYRKLATMAFKIKQVDYRVRWKHLPTCMQTLLLVEIRKETVFHAEDSCDLKICGGHSRWTELHCMSQRSGWPGFIYLQSYKFKIQLGKLIRLLLEQEYSNNTTCCLLPGSRRKAQDFTLKIITRRLYFSGLDTSAVKFRRILKDGTRGQKVT